MSRSLQIRWSSRNGTRSAASSKWMRIGVRLIRHRPSSCARADKKLSLAKSVAALIPITLIGGEVTNLVCAGRGPVCERPEAYTTGTVEGRCR